MHSRKHLVCLISTLALYAALTFAARQLGASAGYHRVLAAVLDPLYPKIDPSGAVKHVDAHSGEFLFRIRTGSARSTLHIAAPDVTSN